MKLEAGKRTDRCDSDYSYEAHYSILHRRLQSPYLMEGGERESKKEGEGEADGEDEIRLHDIHI